MNGPASPYKGLTPFGDSELDALFFFGREREQEIVVANMLAARLTVFYGPSGVGKSSVLRAGAVRRLRALPEGAPVVLFDAWGDDPARRLREVVAEAAGIAPAATLADTLEGVGDLYLVLDQIEEFFLYHGEEGDGLVAELPEVVTRQGLRTNVLVSLREDALARLDVFKGRVPGLFSNVLRLDHLDRDAARSAIVRPLERWGELTGEEVAIEQALVEAVLDQVETGKVVHGPGGRGVVRREGGPGQVETPYLQLVMERLWERSRAEGARTLRLADLDRLGGAARIVEDHLERALGGLTAREKDVAAAVFNHLVTPSGTKIAHATGDLAQYAGVPPSELEPVVRRLETQRLLRPVSEGDGSAVEIFHDVLADAVLTWRARHRAERAVERERERARRGHRRLAALAGISFAALVLMAGVTIFALSQRSDARAKAKVAKARELDAAAATQLLVDPELSLLLARDAARLSPTAQAEDVLRDSIISSRLRAVLPADAPVVKALYTPDGRRLVVGAADGSVRVFDARTTRLLRRLRLASPMTALALGPDSKLVAAAGRDGRVRVWDVTGARRAAARVPGRLAAVAFDRTGRRIVLAGTSGGDVLRVGSPRLTVVDDRPLRDALFSPDGRFVLALGRDREARLFDARTGRLTRTFRQPGLMLAAAFDPQGRFVATAGADRTARLWSLRTGRLVRELKGHQGYVVAVAFDPRGKLLATGSTDGSARIWLVPTGELVTVLLGHRGYVTGLAWNPTGFSVVTTSRDTTARVWQPGTGALRALLAGAGDAVTGASFRPDGRAVVTASDDGKARVWDPRVQPELTPLAHFRGPVAGAFYAAGGDLVSVAGPGASARILRADTGRAVRSLKAAGNVAGAALSPDGRFAATAGAGGVELWNARTGERLRTYTRESAGAVAFSADGRLAAGVGRAARVWDVEGRRLLSLRGHRRRVTAVSFSPDGALVATASADDTARLWDASTGRVRHVLKGHRDDVTSVRFSPDGRNVVTASVDHDPRVWDVATGSLVRRLLGHFAVVSDAEYSSDGRWIVTAGPATAGLWQARSGRLLLFLRGHQARLTSASFDPDGRRIVTAGVDGTVRVWSCDVCATIDGLLALADERLAATGRTLTLAERRQYLPSLP